MVLLVLLALVAAGIPLFAESRTDPEGSALYAMGRSLRDFTEAIVKVALIALISLVALSILASIVMAYLW